MEIPVFFKFVTNLGYDFIVRKELSVTIDI